MSSPEPLVSLDPGLPAEQVEALRELCGRTLALNWFEGEHDGTPFAYTRPNPERYPWQWYWDSCFTGITWRRFDRDRARRELETLLAAQREDGFIGHTAFWGKPLSGPRVLFYNVIHRSDFRTASIQPPLLAWAWKMAVGDPSEVEAIRRHHEWLSAHRDLDGDGLLWLVQPDESGLDASPKFDPVWGWRAQGLPTFPLLVRRNRKLGYDLDRVAAAGGPVLCEVVTNVLWGLSRLAMGQSSITPALVERLYDERRGLFIDEARPAVTGRRPLTWDAMAPLALPDLPEEIGRRLIEEHLLDPEQFWLPVPPPAVAINDPSYQVKDTFLGLRRYWRGPSWINAAWLLWLGMVRLGYQEEAAELVRRLADTVSREGLREYYESRSGTGMGAEQFAWSSLIVELVDPDPAAIGSYLNAAPADAAR